MGCESSTDKKKRNKEVARPNPRNPYVHKEDDFTRNLNEALRALHKATSRRSEPVSNGESPDEINAARNDKEQAERIKRERENFIDWGGYDRKDNAVVETINYNFSNDYKKDENQQNQGGIDAGLEYYQAINQQQYYNDN